jgi:DNA-binding NtrC family response regulator
VDVRVIAATHQNLAEMVTRGEFREDLFYRLNVIPISIPPLRERGRDVIELAGHFLRTFCEENHRKIAGLTREAEERLLSYSWPGNVRELENCIERAVVLGLDERIDAADLLLSGPRREGATDQVVDALFDSRLTLDELEQEIIRTSLERCGGNLSRTARILGLTRRTLQYRVEKIRAAARAEGDEEEPSP